MDAGNREPNWPLLCEFLICAQICGDKAELHNHNRAAAKLAASRSSENIVRFHR